MSTSSLSSQTRSLTLLQSTFRSIAVAAVVILVGAVIPAIHVSVDVIALSMLSLVLLTPIVVRLAQRRFDPFEPIVVFAVAYGVMFVARPASVMIDGELLIDRPLSTIDISGTWSEMLWLSAVGGVAFVGAYSLPIGGRIGKSLRPLPASLDVNRAVLAALAFVVAGAVSFVAFSLTQGGWSAAGLLLSGRSLALTSAVTESSKYFWYGPYMLIPAALVIYALGRQRRNGTLIFLSVGIATLVLVRAVPLGSRMMLLPLLLGLIIYHYVSRASRPTARALIFVGCVGLASSSVILGIRDAHVREQDSLTRLARASLAPARMVAPLTEGHDAAMAPLFAAALAQIPETVPHQYGRAVGLDLVTRPIPRGWWSGKPLPPREQVIRVVWPGDAGAVIANPEFSPLLYFFLDFGLAGVAIGMAVYGTLARALYEYFRTSESVLGARLFFSLAIPFVIVAMRDSTTDTAMRAAFVLLPLVCILRVSSANCSSPRAARS